MEVRLETKAVNDYGRIGLLMKERGQLNDLEMGHHRFSPLEWELQAMGHIYMKATRIIRILVEGKTKGGKTPPDN
jgi:hypothetical protein